MYPAQESDPCELSFSGYRQVDGRSLPGRIEVRVGEQRYGVLMPAGYDLAKK